MRAQSVGTGHSDDILGQFNNIGVVTPGFIRSLLRRDLLKPPVAMHSTCCVYGDGKPINHHCQVPSCWRRATSAVTVSFEQSVEVKARSPQIIAGCCSPISNVFPPATSSQKNSRIAPRPWISRSPQSNKASFLVQKRRSRRRCQRSF
jgi:hypothetical protein